MTFYEDLLRQSVDSRADRFVWRPEDRVFACRPCECGGHPDCPDCGNGLTESDGARERPGGAGGPLTRPIPSPPSFSVSPCPCEGGEGSGCVCQ